MGCNYNKDYWLSYYQKYRIQTMPSSFALFCRGFMDKDDSVLDLGCGNGRDSIYFNAEGLLVTAMDIADNHEQNIIKHGIKFIKNDFCKEKELFNLEDDYDFVYARFLLHAIPEDIEDYILNESYEILTPRGMLCIEARSDKGFVSSLLPIHYRRLINYDKLVWFLRKLGFYVLYKIEQKNLAIYKDDNPVILRIICQK